MVESLTIENFRCFERVELSALAPINIIVGRNASGKTALLEAIFLAAGSSPELTMRIRQWRGIPPTYSGPQQELDEALWSDLFFHFDVQQPIAIEITDRRHGDRTLLISSNPAGEIALPLGANGGGEGPQATAPISFTWRSRGREPVTASPTIQGNQISFPSIPPWSLLTHLFATHAPHPGEQNVRAFSALSKRNKQENVINVLKREFRFIEDLSIELHSGVSTLYASLKNYQNKVPLALVSSGITKMASIILAIVASRSVVVLVDEIENGFYYDRLPSIWRILADLCEKYDAQIFATTHSLECLRAGASVAEQRRSGFTLLRTERLNGRSEVKQFSGSAFADAIGEDIEVR
jgi:predicted ATPase